MRSRIIKLFLGGFGLLFTYFIVSTSLNVRMWADDFCTAAVLGQRGFWNSQVFSWLSWSGRYSYNFFIYLFMLFGPKMVAFVPILVFFLLVITLGVFLVILLPKKKYLAILLSLAYILIVFINTPNIIQSLYWYSGDLVYTFPFIFFNLFLALFLYVAQKGIKNKKLFFVVSFALLFVSTGFSESLAPPFLIFMAFLYLFNSQCPNKNSKRAGFTLVAGAFGTIFSLVIMYLAPGTALRSSVVDKPYSLWWAVTSSYDSAKMFFVQIFSSKPFYYSISLIFSLIYFFLKFADNKSKAKYKATILIPLTIAAAFLTTVCFYFVSYFSMAYHPPERALVVPVYFIFFYSVILLVVVITEITKNLTLNLTKRVDIVVFLVFLLSIALLARDTYRRWKFLGNDVKTYADAWDLQERSIEEQALTGNRVVIKYVPPVGRIDGFKDNKGWVTGCAAGFYKVKQFVVE
jgi:hypothetical protein